MRFRGKDKITVSVLLFILILSSYARFFNASPSVNHDVKKIIDTIPNYIYVTEEIQTKSGNATVATGRFYKYNCQELTKFVNYIQPNTDFNQIYDSLNIKYKGNIVSIDGKPKAKSVPLITLGLLPAFTSAKHSGFCAAIKVLPYILKKEGSLGLYGYDSNSVNILSSSLNYNIDGKNIGNSYTNTRLSLNIEQGTLVSISVFTIDTNNKLTMTSKITFHEI